MSNVEQRAGQRAPRTWVAPTVTVVAVLLLWQAVVSFGLVPSFLLPSPTDVALALVTDAPVLSQHALVTVGEALIGLACGVAAGFLIACLMERFAVVRRALAPIVTVSQTIPTVAIAPLLVLWLGYGMLPKVLLVALTTFFPITVALAEGFASVDPDTVDLMRTMGASRMQVFRYAKLPAAAGSFFSGLRISATYAVVGAVVAEWLGGFEGLGVYMTRVRKSYSYDQMFAVIVIISVLSLALMGLVDALERWCMPWRRAERKATS
ncbi:ABC transporter permease [Olsenella sp. YH-ols2217]|uniref:ABC transporter permease n=1 Tax=Kribbibacterium absianum TaxID=3044210 RepID=A0ABT6ZM99_9ACTN|nr:MULTISPECIES: ABC transporter permease [unclassified Olsenella]MDJ1121994.1 ABC transporter permease [Olsenella sp. YH-ols2216]MDJ1130002.1 ABC transporter permease [Olsenella sp. YH-ols2217]